jgi:hypothetical protein
MEFSKGKDNQKLRKLHTATGKKIYSFSLLSGHTCPFARDCKAKAVMGESGKRHVEDGPEMQFRCFSASQEAFYTATYEQRARNTEHVKSLLAFGSYGIANAIVAAIPKNAEVIRIHVGGDFFHQNYFKAWCHVAEARPDIQFYCYTKALVFLLMHGSMVPENLKITMSRGGTHDHLIEELKERGFHEAVVVYREEDTDLPIDSDDSHALHGEESFALLVHGGQPKGSEAAKYAYQNRSVAV